MHRPPSIVRFERMWWTSALLSLIAAYLSWDRVQHGIRARFAVDPALRANPFGAVVVDWTQVAGVAITIAWTVIVWFLVTRRASGAGRWLAVLTAVLSGVQLAILLGGLALGRTLHPLSHGAAAAAAVLTMIAAAALFTSASRTWFGEADETERQPV
ncbi:hypothetical protein [uncultured Sphingomonas sp.]|uniref:hypothetical protein n=1 Tax=uncultured Sphingomonas sp. TaxID=158754 RepID=UPI0035CA7F4D